MARAAVKTRAKRVAPPKLRVEQGCFEAGAQLVCGIDEVGRGAWAGPVTVGAVVIGPTPKRIQRVRARGKDANIPLSTIRGWQGTID